MEYKTINEVNREKWIQPKSKFLEKIKRVDKPLTRLIWKEKREEPNNQHHERQSTDN